MKRIITTIYIILFAYTQAQNTINSSLPDIKPPSAETYRFSTYNSDFTNTPSGEFTYNLPIYSIEKGVNIPISLAYNSSVKVDDIGGSTGISWQLISGGTISRIVRDEQDEMSASAWFPQTLDETANASQIREAAHPDNSIDTEYDWFSFSLSNGISGQFYIDKELNVHYNGGDGSKLSVTDKTTMVTLYGKKLEFILTDNQGNMYYFGGGDKFMERTRINYRGPNKSYTSGWYLSKVITNKNEVINFDYFIEDITYYASMSAYFSVSENCCNKNTYDYNPLVKNRTTISSLKPQLLTIDDDSVKVNFIYNKERKDVLNGNGKLLTSIVVLSTQNNQQIKKYQLNYDDVNAGLATTYYGVLSTEQSTVNRHFLNNVQDVISTQKFTFEYYSKEGIPGRFSLATDFYGYSNSRNNQSPFPSQAGQIPSVISSKIPYGFTNANKEVAPERTYFGNLKRIYYPTGGYSEITYESNSSAEKTPVEKYEITGLEASRNCIGPKTVRKKFTFISNGTPLTYNAYASVDYSDCGDPDFHEVHGISIRNLTNPNAPAHNNSGNYSITLINTFPIPTVAGHTYEVEYNVSSYFGRISGLASVQYNRRTEMEDILKHYGGSRVKKIEENNIENGSYKRLFYYNTLANRLSQKTSIANETIPKFFDYIMTIRNCKLECTSVSNPNELISLDDIPVYRFYKDNILSDFNDRSNKIFYKTITEIIDSNKAIEKKYLYESDIQGYSSASPILDAPHSNNGQIKRGLLQNEKQYSFRNNSFNIFKEITNTYSFTQNSITSFIFRENFKLPTGYYNNLHYGPIPNISYTFYQNYYGYSKLIESLSKKYINGNVLETKVNTSYSNNQHLQPTTQKVIYPDASANETTYKYAHEKGNQLMITKNMVGIPMETTTTQINGNTSKMVSKMEMIFPTVLPTYGVGNLILPLSIKSYNIQNSTPSTEITYNWYNGKGHLLQYTLKNGIPVTIIWGYNNTQPIAKIEGISYRSLLSTAQSSVTQIITASDSDAANPTTEPTLITALDNFRKNSGLSAYQISTYTYDPLIGVTSITQPSGIREVYIYDTSNLLKEIREDSKTGKLIKDFKYNYKN